MKQQYAVEHDQIYNIDHIKYNYEGVIIFNRIAVSNNFKYNRYERKHL